MRYPGARSQPLTLQVATEGQREIRLDIGEIAEVSSAEVTYDANGRMSSTQLVKQDTYRSYHVRLNTYDKIKANILKYRRC